jgi:hypothetical protein
MRFEAHKGSRSGDLHTIRCLTCDRLFESRGPKHCGDKDCERMRKRLWARRHKNIGARRVEGLSAPALKTACEALEAQLTPENRPHWRQIIENFRVPPTSGYRDLTRLTQQCVTARRFHG